jgi:hypothetical protein
MSDPALCSRIPHMKFAKIVFWIAGIWGILVLTPLFFIYNMIGRQDPPPITHPAFYYGFVTCGLAWQIAFLVIAQDPVRLRPLILPSALEKFGYAAALIVLFMQHHLHASDLTLGLVDVLFGVLFIISYVKT